MLKEILFYIVVVVGNVIQTATGFAGTMIMMPPSIRLVGIETAKPVLAVYAVAVSLFLFIRERRHINWREFFKIIILMMVGMAVGVAAERAASFRLLTVIYGVFLIGYTLFKAFAGGRKMGLPEWLAVAVIIAAGALQSIFLSGGALLVVYAAGALPDKDEFRATLAPVWVVLNTVLILTYLRGGLFVGETVKIGLIGLLPLALGIIIGNLLHRKIPQRSFTRLTFVLLLINGVALLFK